LLRLSNAYGVFVIDILDYTNTNKYTTVITLIGQNQYSSGTGANITLTSGNWRNTAAITSINFTTTLTLAQYTQLALYGIKG
jgi:hypothetical protein